MAVVGLCLTLSRSVIAQTDAGEAKDASDLPATTMFEHSKTSAYWISGQDNIIFQAHPGFPAKYSGPNSFRNTAEDATSNVATLYLGLSARRSTELFLNVESASGGGLSDALGLAGFTNLDVVRNPELGAKPYIARAMIRQIIPLSSEMVESERVPRWLPRFRYAALNFVRASSEWRIFLM
jgi:hypothetical protein